MANTLMPSCPTREDATSSCVDSGLLLHRRSSAPTAASVRARLAVSEVTCRQAARRRPRSGFSRLNRSRMLRTTGIWASAQRMRVRPLPASPLSFTSHSSALTLGSFPHAPAETSGAGRFAEIFRPVGLLPGEPGIAPPEMSERGGTPVDRSAQVQGLDDFVGRQAEGLPNQPADPCLLHAGPAPCVHPHPAR